MQWQSPSDTSSAGLPRGYEATQSLERLQAWRSDSVVFAVEAVLLRAFFAPEARRVLVYSPKAGCVLVFASECGEDCCLAAEDRIYIRWLAGQQKRKKPSEQTKTRVPAPCWTTVAHEQECKSWASPF